MPCLSANYNPEIGPLLQVMVIKNPMEQPAGVDEKSLFRALIDTGASGTCISRNVINACGLKPEGKAEMANAGGVSLVNQFSFGIGFIVPSDATKANLTVMPVTGCEFVTSGTMFDILLGRDVICSGNLNISFDGHFVFCF